MLARQCRIAPAEAAALVRLSADRRVQVLASHPASTNGQAKWIAEAARHVPGPESGRIGHVFPSTRPGEPAFACIPVGGEDVWALYLLAHSAADPALVAERLALSAAAFQSGGADAETGSPQQENRLLRSDLSTLIAMAAHERFTPIAMALCNHAASEWRCDRVSLGMVRGPYIRVEAMSHAEKFERRSALVQGLESVMEEALDQDEEIVLPAEASSTTLDRAAREFASRYGPLALASIPIRRAGKVLGVLTLERAPSEPFSIAEIASLRLLAEAAAPHLSLAHRHRHRLGSALAGSMRAVLETLLGPRYAWAKFTTIGLALATLALALIPATYRVRADARVEATDRRAIVGPFEGYLLETAARAGDLVDRGQVLARLDTSELMLRLGALQAEQEGAMREAGLASRERKDAEAQIARARAKRAEAEIALVESQIAQATIRAPIDGIIVSGDLERAVGAPVRPGDALFEIASPGAVRVEVFIAEDQVGDVKPGSRGSLATLSRPEVKMPVEIVRVDPVAEIRAGRNVFRAIASLSESPDWLRPGMEGVVRIDAGSSSYPRIWTRRIVNWMRMRLWV